ncbi:hypothetical protein McanMca71_007602 [Microsporum canis]|uniref:Alpha/beta hydrolase fold-3 domain-containing protein n=1 Tax=Arthroderma otae (strain ATCC MYA-4605 / CBS 113480) TaxID=554155 RepID=C5G0T4_ARTOC|nr:conserved hypothetical protein [Microsporum canis CBS 113480]EEQ35737.1 conserved hypothetical protein [Microsporum canis CBS 113480]
MRPSVISASTAFLFLHKNRIILSRHIKRSLSNAAASYLRENVVQVPVGSSGNITLTVLSPIEKPGPDLSNLIVYLPPGPLFDTSRYRRAYGSSSTRRHSSGVSKKGSSSLLPEESLAITTLSTTVAVKYRLGRVQVDGKQKTYRYPTPVHDTLAGLDWAMNEFQPDNVFVFGRHIGGSLAIMLALTEARGLKAVAAEEPVCDWVGLDDYCITDIETDGKLRAAPYAEESEIEQDNEADTSPNARKRGRKKKEPIPTPSDLVPLLDARRRLFPTPEKYFDAFASPTLFLRTSGKYIPLTFPVYLTGPEYPSPVLKRQPKTEADALYMTDLLSSSPARSSSSGSTCEGSEVAASEPPLTSLIKPVRKRKVLSRWPPSGLDYGLEAYESKNRWVKREETVLPDVRIFVHDQDAQAARMENQGNATNSGEGSGGDEGLSAQMQAAKLNDVHNEHGMTTQSLPSERKPRSSTRFRGSLRNIGRISGDTVLTRQGKEMVSLMHNACFWGREKGAAERCVKLVPIAAHDRSQIPRPTDSELHTVDATTDLDSISQQSHPVEVQAGRHFMDLLRNDTSE